VEGETRRKETKGRARSVVILEGDPEEGRKGKKGKAVEHRVKGKQEKKSLSLGKKTEGEKALHADFEKEGGEEKEGRRLIGSISATESGEDRGQHRKAGSQKE